MLVQAIHKTDPFLVVGIKLERREKGTVIFSTLTVWKSLGFVRPDNLSVRR